MLVDVKRDKKLDCLPGLEKEFKKLLREMGEWKLWRIQKGLYHSGINPHLILQETIKDEWPENIRCPVDVGSGELLIEDVNCFGVCDSPDQFIERYIDGLISDPRSLFVTFFRIDKKSQPKRGGWRWHKWGPYIGDKKPKCEYLKDEDDSIQVVYAYHIREARE